MTYEDFEQTPLENVQRGTIFTLVVIPAGIVVWVLLWSVGFIASLVGWAIAWAALRLYLIGSHGVISRTGAIRVTIVTAVTIVASLFAGIAADVAKLFVEKSGEPFLPAMLSPEFWSFFWSNTDAIVQTYGVNILLALGLGALGCFSTLRRAFVATAPQTASTQIQPFFPPREAAESPEDEHKA